MQNGSETSNEGIHIFRSLVHKFVSLQKDGLNCSKKLTTRKDVQT